MRYMTLRSFRFHNPDWHIQLYRAKIQTRQKYWRTGQTQDFQSARQPQDYSGRIADLDIEQVDWQHRFRPANPVNASDLFQWWFMKNVGGVYADMDILWISPLETLYRLHADADTWLTIWRNMMAIGFMAGSGGDNPFYGRLLESAIERKRTFGSYQSAGTNALGRLIEKLAAERQVFPRCSTACQVDSVVCKSFPGLKIANIGRFPVYPFLWTQTLRIFGDDEPDADLAGNGTVGIHWYAGDSLSQWMNRRLTEANFHEYDCVFTRYAGRVLQGAMA